MERSGKVMASEESRMFCVMLLDPEREMPERRNVVGEAHRRGTCRLGVGSGGVERGEVAALIVL